MDSPSSVALSTKTSVFAARGRDEHVNLFSHFEVVRYIINFLHYLSLHILFTISSTELAKLQCCNIQDERIELKYSSPTRHFLIWEKG